MRRLIAIIAILTILIGCLTAQADEQEYFVICNPESYVWVRRSPKKASQEEGYLEIGDSVWSKGEKRNGFLKVYADGIEGWVFKGYLIETPPTVDKHTATVVSNARVACRRYVNGSKQGWVKNGQEVMVYAEGDGWAVTNKGFVKAEYLE